MKRYLDKLLKYLTITVNNFLINICVKIFLPQKIHADETYYMNKFHELKSNTKNSSNINFEFNIPDNFILPLALKTIVVKKKSNLNIDYAKILYSELRKYISNNNFDFINHDVTKYIDIKDKIDYVFHLASPASPIDYLNYPIQTLKANAIGGHNALGLAKKNKAKFILASTSEV